MCKLTNTSLLNTTFFINIQTLCYNRRTIRQLFFFFRIELELNLLKELFNSLEVDLFVDTYDSKNFKKLTNSYIGHLICYCIVEQYSSTLA